MAIETSHSTYDSPEYNVIVCPSPLTNVPRRNENLPTLHDCCLKQANCPCSSLNVLILARSSAQPRGSLSKELLLGELMTFDLIPFGSTQGKLQNNVCSSSLSGTRHTPSGDPCKGSGQTSVRVQCQGHCFSKGVWTFI